MSVEELSIELIASEVAKPETLLRGTSDVLVAVVLTSEKCWEALLGSVLRHSELFLLWPTFFTEIETG